MFMFVFCLSGCFFIFTLFIICFFLPFAFDVFAGFRAVLFVCEVGGVGDALCYLCYLVCLSVAALLGGVLLCSVFYVIAEGCLLVFLCCCC